MRGRRLGKCPTGISGFFCLEISRSLRLSAPLSSTPSFKALISQLSDDPELAVVDMTKILIEKSGGRLTNFEDYFSRLFATVSGWAA